jgi:hypothetical protein
MFRFSVAVLAATVSATAFARPAEHRLGEHPAVIVKRLEASRGYDYASKFYPHPAWLYLSAVPPDPVLQADAARPSLPEAAVVRAAAATPVRLWAVPR